MYICRDIIVSAVLLTNAPIWDLISIIAAKKTRKTEPICKQIRGRISKQLILVFRQKRAKVHLRSLSMHSLFLTYAFDIKLLSKFPQAVPPHGRRTWSSRLRFGSHRYRIQPVCRRLEELQACFPRRFRFAAVRPPVYRRLGHRAALGHFRPH